MEITAHGITRVGPAKVSGRHLSEAANEPFTEEQLIAFDLARNLNKAERSERRALERQIDANRRDPLLRGAYE